MAYYNTTNEKGDDLKKYKIKSKSQNVVIMNYIKYNTERYPPFKTTSSRLWRFAFSEKCPLTSVRRSVSDLVSLGVLYYENKTTGIYNRSEKLIRLTIK